MSASKYSQLNKYPVSVVNSEAATSPGTRRWDDGKEYVYVYSTEEIAPYKAVTVTSGYSASVAGAVECVVGVSQGSTLTTGTYGWVQTRGIATLSSAAIAGGSLVQAGAAGVPVSGATGNFAVALNTSTASTQVIVNLR